MLFGCSWRQQERDSLDVCVKVVCVCVCVQYSVCMRGLFVVDSLDGPTVEQVSDDGAR